MNLEQIFESRSPGFLTKRNRLLGKAFIRILERLLHLREMNEFISAHPDLSGLALINEFFDYLDFSFYISSKDQAKIPDEGKLICVANHPLGGLDGLTLLKAIGTIRGDVKIIANDVLIHIESISELLLPFDVFSKRPQRRHIANIDKTLENDEAVIFFPAAEVSRFTYRGIKDRGWHKGPVYFSQKHKAPILPIYISAKNSVFFYAFSLINKRLSMFLLAHEIFGKQSKTITLKVGDPIPASVISALDFRLKASSRLLRRHVYRLGANKKGIFKTEKNIVRPEDPKVLKKELASAEKLGTTSDGKKIYLVSYEQGKNLLREIARLREVTFRRVGEGTGLAKDMDEFDTFYRHIILWDDDNLEIVGAYRLGICSEILSRQGLNGLYTTTLFNFSQSMYALLPQAVELGRSFVQKRYWRSNALDYLWQGIGAFLATYPEIKYLFGAVSISNSYSEEAKDLIVHFYKKWFPDKQALAVAKNRYNISAKKEQELKALFSGHDFKSDLQKLKEYLKQYGFAIPILYKQYTDLCQDGGVRFMDFGVDKNFASCVDGLILVQIDMIKSRKRERYLAKAEEAVRM